MGFGRTLSRAIMPPEKALAWRWCEDHLRLDPPQPTPMPGPYRTNLTPWVRGWMDAWQNDSTREITIEKAGQTAATQTMFCLIAYGIVMDPGPMLVVLDSEDNARSVSETRCMPLIDASPDVCAEKPLGAHDMKKLEYRMRRCTVRWVGANSAGKLASRPVRYLYMDELDKYGESVGREGSTSALAEKRTAAYRNRRIWKASTPTTESGAIHRAFLDGDQRRFFVPCWKCAAVQFLKWSQVKFDSALNPSEAGTSAFYECEHCKARWNNLQKNDSVQKGEWRATAKPKRKGCVSFHLWALYATWETCSIEALVAKFLSVKDDPARLREFVNEDLGEVWVEASIGVQSAEILKRAVPYDLGTLFTRAGPLRKKYEKADSIVLMSVDVQKLWMWYLLREWVRGGDSGLYMFGNVATWQELSDIADKHVAPYVLVDCGYGQRATESYEACLLHRFIACKGASMRIPMTWTQTTINIYEGTRKQAAGQSISLILHDTETLKLQLFDRVTGAAPAAWAIPHDAPTQYLAQMDAEEYVNGEWRLKQGRRENHAWDLETLQMLGATIYGYERRIL